ncbi:MAG: hypothetical protein AAGA68_26150 [Pseudomonadota bacterium]
MKSVVDGSAQDLLRASPIIVYKPKLAAVVGKPSQHRFEEFHRADSSRASKLALPALGRITYRHDDRVNRSEILPGHIGVPLVLCEEARQVNALKDALKDALRPIRGRQIRYRDEQGVARKRELTTEMLRRLGASDVNLYAAYRHLPVVDHAVQRLSYTVVRNQNIEQCTVDELTARLLDREPTEDRQADLDTLATLPGNEIVGRLSDFYERIRVLVYLDPGAPRRSITFPGELPLLFPILPSARAPAHRPPRAWVENPRRPRPPKRLETAPFLLTAAYCRYLTDHRRYR